MNKLASILSDFSLLKSDVVSFSYLVSQFVEKNIAAVVTDERLIEEAQMMLQPTVRGKSIAVDHLVSVYSLILCANADNELIEMVPGATSYKPLLSGQGLGAVRKKTADLARLLWSIFSPNNQGVAGLTKEIEKLKSGNEGAISLSFRQGKQVPKKTVNSYAELEPHLLRLKHTGISQLFGFACSHDTSLSLLEAIINNLNTITVFDETGQTPLKAVSN